MQRPLSEAPALLSRLAGAPARLEDILFNIQEPLLRRKHQTLDGKLKWSALDHAGHLGDLERLHYRRVREILDGADTLSAADMSNAATEEAHHNRQPIGPLLERFRTERTTLVNFLYTLQPVQFGLSAVHPRLGAPMRIIDLCEFYAEHDDHHLATIRELIWNPQVYR
ncbi:MAG TPA: DinB family protein [candidate division Zixibacteria bacterium]|nr:DinB family protein [candidate division Zixibacteria bacterium]